MPWVRSRQTCIRVKGQTLCPVSKTFCFISNPTLTLGPPLSLWESCHLTTVYSVTWVALKGSNDMLGVGSWLVSAGTILDLAVVPTDVGKMFTALESFVPGQFAQQASHPEQWAGLEDGWCQLSQTALCSHRALKRGTFEGARIPS